MGDEVPVNMTAKEKRLAEHRKIREEIIRKIDGRNEEAQKRHERSIVTIDGQRFCRVCVEGIGMCLMKEEDYLRNTFSIFYSNHIFRKECRPSPAALYDLDGSLIREAGQKS